MTAPAPFITVTKGLRGHFAVMVWWNPDPGFWEPWQTGIGSYETATQAAVEGRDWAEAEGLIFKAGDEQMTTITKENEYDWYKAALAGKKPPIHDGDVQSGRFRMKPKNAPAIAVGIWRDWANGGVLMANYDLKAFRCDEKAEPTVGPDGKPRATNYHKLAEKWTYLAGSPIPPGIYDAFLDSNCTKWPDESPAGAETRAAAEAEKTNKPAPVTFVHAIDTPEGIKERLDKYGLEVEAMIKAGAATDQLASDIAADYVNVFAGLENTAEKQRAAQKKPHWDAGQAVDKVWNPLKEAAATLKIKIKREVIDPYHAKAQAKINEEHAANLARANESNVPLTPGMQAAPRVSSGTVGRRVAPRSVCHAVITDPRAFLAVLVGNDQIHPGILEAMQVIADAGGSTDPTKCATYAGVTYEQKQVS